MSSFIILKPDCVREHKVGELIARLETAGFRIHEIFNMDLKADEVADIYKDHKEKDFYPRLEEQMMSGTSIVMNVVGPVELIRSVALQIRKDYERENPDNLIHASDSTQAAERELEIFGMDYA
jgi:nucleoside-diphosphate kinase